VPAAARKPAGTRWRRCSRRSIPRGRQAGRRAARDDRARGQGTRRREGARLDSARRRARESPRGGDGARRAARQLGRSARSQGHQHPAQREGRVASYHETLALVDAIKGGRVGVLLVHGANRSTACRRRAASPRRSRSAVRRVARVAADETSERANLVLPDHSPLESWATPSRVRNSLGGTADAAPALRHARARRHAPRRRPCDGSRGRRETAADSFRTLVEQSLPVRTSTPRSRRRCLRSAAGSRSDAGALRSRFRAGGAGARRRRRVHTGHRGGLDALRRSRCEPGWLQEVPDPVTKVLGSRTPSCRRARPRNSAASSSAT